MHDTVAADLPLPGEDLLEVEKRRYLRAAVLALPDRMRLIVEAVYFGDRTVTDVAAELGITHSAVSQQRSEAMRLLRDGLAAHYGDGGATPGARVPHHRGPPQCVPRPRRDERPTAGVARAVFDASAPTAVAAG